MSVNGYTPVAEGMPLVSFNAPTGQHGENSTPASVLIIVCAMAGVGILGLPNGLAQAGWIGLVILLVCVLCSMYTGTLIGAAIRDCQDENKHIRDYADIGEHALGRPGRILAQFAVYTTLAGVAIIFLILIGLLSSAIVPQIPRGFWTLCVGLVIVLPLSLGLKTLAEVKWLSYLGVLATVVVAVVAVISPLVFRVSSSYSEQYYEWGFNTEILHPTINPGVVGSFAVFTFAFGATALFPNIYLAMEQPKEWPWAVSMGYIVVLFITLPVTVVGYAVYGKFLLQESTILDAVLKFDSHSGAIVCKAALAIMVVHIMSALPLIMNPVFRFVELNLLGEPPLPTRLIERATIIALTILLALFFPYFLEVMSLVSCISVSLSGYILPCVYYWRIYRPSSARVKLQLGAVVVFGFVGSVVGIYVNGTVLVQAVKAGGNPFTGLFHFGFT